MASHIMELPRKILIGENNISDIGNFLVDLSNPKKVSLVSGDQVRKITDKKISTSLSDSKIKYVWHRSTSNDVDAAKKHSLT